MPAQITSYSTDQIEFGSPLFDESVALSARHVGSFGFIAGSQVPDPDRGNSFTFRLISGDRLTGALVSLTGTDCVIDSRVFGQLVVPRANIIEITRPIDGEGQVVFSALNWQPLGTSFRPDSQGRIVVGPATATRLAVPSPLDKAGRVGIEFLGGSQTDFHVEFRNNKAKVVASLGVADGTLVVEAGNDLAFGECDTGHGLVRLDFNWDGAALDVLSAKGQSLLRIGLKSLSELSVSIKSEGAALSLTEIVVTPKVESMPNPLSTKGTWLKSAKGEWKSVAALEVSEGGMEYTDTADVSHRMKIEEVAAIWLGASDEAHGAPLQTDRLHTCFWRGGQRVRFSQVKLTEGQLAFETDQFKSSGVIIGDLPAEVFVPEAAGSREPEPTDAADGSAGPFRLSISGIPFSGAYSWGDAGHPIRWKFFGFDDPVSLNIKRKIEVRRSGGGGTQSRDLSKGLIVLKDGSLVPCKIQSANEHGMVFDAERVQVSRIPLEHIRCCFFDARVRSWKKLLTSETVQRALVLPRPSRDAGLTHILIGKNGDLLRGCFVGLGAESLEFESRSELMSIPRANVAGIVAVDSSLMESSQEAEAAVAGEPEQIVAHVSCGDGFLAVGQYKSFDRFGAALSSPVLGKLQIAGEDIRSVSFNTRSRNMTGLQDFADWQLSSCIEPRWSMKAEVAADASELLDQPAPDFEASFLDDSRSFRVSEHLGKVVVINFWESTSRPSVVGIPEYRKVMQKFSPQDVLFVAPNQGETASAIRKFLATENWSAVDVVIDPTRDIARQYKVSGIPQLVIIDRDGRIRKVLLGYSQSGAAELEAQVRKLLSE